MPWLLSAVLLSAPAPAESPPAEWTVREGSGARSHEPPTPGNTSAFMFRGPAAFRPWSLVRVLDGRGTWKLVGTSYGADLDGVGQRRSDWADATVALSWAPAGWQKRRVLSWVSFVVGITASRSATSGQIGVTPMAGVAITPRVFTRR
jgi:hypothetical protein